MANEAHLSPLTYTNTQTHSQETHLKPFCLFVSVSISLYTSRTTELIEKVKRLQTDDRRKKSVPVSSIHQGKEWTPASFSILLVTSVHS